jgi:hypothetical protein
LLLHISNNDFTFVKAPDEGSHVEFVDIERQVYDSAKPMLVIWLLA